MDAFVEVLKVQVLPVLASVAAAILVLLLERALRYVRLRVAQVDQDIVRAVLTRLVDAAEQKFGSGAGKDKYTYVVRKAAEIGLDVDESEIEAIVAMMNGKAAG
jgi:hypothetical protein